MNDSFSFIDCIVAGVGNRLVSTRMIYILMFCSGVMTGIVIVSYS